MTNEDRGGKARRGARREGRGLVSVLLGTALLAVLGFGLGIVAGLVLEEPGLLLDYVAGKTNAAPLDATRSANRFAATEREQERVAEVTPAASPPATEAAPVAAPDVAAAPPSAPSSKSAPLAAIEAEPTPDTEMSASAPLAPATPPAGRGYSVQVGALADAASAEQLAVKLRKRGFPVYVAPSAEPGSKRWRVRVGPVASREQADELATTLAREKLPTWILAEGPR